MAAPKSLPALLESLTQSLTSALEATPKLASIGTPSDGISLLDTKNELLLSYLQNLVFLILLKIRNAKNDYHRDSDGEDDGAGSKSLSDTVVKKLVELRLYLDKGVRPLEEKLQFQIDKILRAADDADRNEKMAKPATKTSTASGSESGSGDEEGIEDEEDVDDARRTAKSTSHSADKKYGPSINAFARSSGGVGMAAAGKTSDKTGVYRPPKIAPTTMPTTERRERRERRPLKSAVMDEFIADEYSTAPLDQPNVGSTIGSRGRTHKTTAERQEEARKREYEESNFTRLPQESKKDRAKRGQTERRSARMSFGGEDWRDLNEGVDRISRVTGRKERGGGTRALLEKSRKRTRETTDSGRQSGLSSGTKEIGERFNKKLKVMEGGRRDRAKR